MKSLTLFHEKKKVNLSGKAAGIHPQSDGDAYVEHNQISPISLQ